MHPIGLGTSIVECLRIAQLIERHGEIFLQRVFTPDEIQYCSARKAATQHYAGRWAAKEATLKSLGSGWTRGVAWRDIVIENDGGDETRVVLHGGVRELAMRLGVTQTLLSIAHCRTHATATAISWGGTNDA